jgi:hypothetical protein
VLIAQHAGSKLCMVDRSVHWPGCGNTFVRNNVTRIAACVAVWLTAPLCYFFLFSAAGTNLRVRLAGVASLQPQTHWPHNPHHPQEEHINGGQTQLSAAQGDLSDAVQTPLSATQEEHSGGTQTPLSAAEASLDTSCGLREVSSTIGLPPCSEAEKPQKDDVQAKVLSMRSKTDKGA